jgi:hypothetical protein
MKRHTTFCLLLSWCCFANTANAQTGLPTITEGGGAYSTAANDAMHPCVAAEEYRSIERDIAAYNKALGIDQTAARKTAATSFSWPLRLAAGLTDCNFYSISAYVDQDTTTGIRDWNCGSNTYDGHRGTDIFIYPYPFYKMDNKQVEVIAAAPGTIVGKTDGNFDRNCASNSLTANYIVIQHADGSEAPYLHMKSGSLTSKIVGNTVTAGEYLGVVGSSGSSTGPHLHFEVWNGTTVATRQDPFSGNCNTLNANSWWAVQPAYRNPAVLKVSVHHAQAVFPACPTTETPNEDSCFATGTASAYFYVFFKDETAGSSATLTVQNSSGTVVNTWVLNSTMSYNGSYHYWTKSLPSTPGVYTFKALYNGQTCQKTFKIDCSTSSTSVSIATGTTQLRISPNPTSDIVTLNADGMPAGAYSFHLRNLLGQEVFSDQFLQTGGRLERHLSIAHLPSGIYLLTLESGAWKEVSRLIKK